ncbi:hypothetical protein NDU88_006212 [Pleurodeles waltl]|uniref:Uncharacterized protein n=1 Tax=Pleurodeles waltl TaxID=8319 RepID=A0AAV7MEC1_PLEWA|nr:hypothetical protein NDU88_006212 [Pleurodeles waltl]
MTKRVTGHHRYHNLTPIRTAHNCSQLCTSDPQQQLALQGSAPTVLPSAHKASEGHPSPRGHRRWSAAPPGPNTAPITSRHQHSQSTRGWGSNPRGRLLPTATTNRLCPGTTGAPLGLRRARQVQPGSTTGPQKAHAGRSPALHSSSPPGRLLASPGSSNHRKTAPQWHPGPGIRPPLRALRHSAQPRHLSAQTSRPDPRGRGSAPLRAAAEGRLPAPTSLRLHRPRSDSPRVNSAPLSPKWRRISRAQCRAPSALVRHV